MIQNANSEERYVGCEVIVFLILISLLLEIMWLLVTLIHKRKFYSNR